jgi:transposase
MFWSCRIANALAVKLARPLRSLTARASRPPRAAVFGALKLQVHSAAIQDRDGAGPLLRASRARWPFVQIGYADGGYLGRRVASASPIRIQVVRRIDKQVGFVVLARRWVVERFFAWINRNRRLAKDVEASVASAEAFLYAASSMLLLRRIAR